MQAFATTAKERLALPMRPVVEQYPSLKPAVLMVWIRVQKRSQRGSDQFRNANSAYQFPAVVPNDAKLILSIVLSPVQPTVRL